MTTPSRTISVLAILASTVLGVVLLVGALEIPVPAVRIEIAMGPQPASAVGDVPPLPPPAPPAPSEARPEPTRIPDLQPSSARETMEALQARRQQPERVEIISRIPEPFEPEPAEEVVRADRPSFTPMTVRPTLTNVAEVQRALIDAYPAVLRDAGIGGAPVLWLYIGTDGTVHQTAVQESSGYEALDAAAATVAEAMRFTPAQNRDQLVPVWVQIPIRFQVVR